MYIYIYIYMCVCVCVCCNYYFYKNHFTCILLVLTSLFYSIGRIVNDIISSSQMLAE